MNDTELQARVREALQRTDIMALSTIDDDHMDITRTGPIGQAEELQLATRRHQGGMSRYVTAPSPSKPLTPAPRTPSTPPTTPNTTGTDLRSSALSPDLTLAAGPSASSKPRRTTGPADHQSYPAHTHKE
jgi:hypothetical protein